MSQGFARGTPGATGVQGPAGSAGAGASGAILSELAPVGPNRFVGRFTPGSGTLEQLTPGQGASLIGGLWGSGLQLLPAPTGGVQGRVLGDNGQFRLFVPSGIAPAQLLPISPLTLLGNASSASGVQSEVRGDQVASMIGRYAASGLGLVPTPTGPLAPTGLTALLDNGQWGTPPMPHLIQTFACAAGAWASGQFLAPQSSQSITTENRGQIPLPYDCLITHAVSHHSRANGGTGLNSFVLRADGSNTTFSTVIPIAGFNGTATGVFTGTSGQLMSVMVMTGVDAAATSAGFSIYGRPR